MAINRFYSVLNSTLKLPPDAFDHYQLLAKTAQFEIAETHFETGNFAEAGKFFGRLRLLDLAPVDRARAHSNPPMQPNWVAIWRRQFESCAITLSNGRLTRTHQRHATCWQPH